MMSRGRRDIMDVSRPSECLTGYTVVTTLL